MIASHRLSIPRIFRDDCHSAGCDQGLVFDFGIRSRLSDYVDWETSAFVRFGILVSGLPSREKRRICVFFVVEEEDEFVFSLLQRKRRGKRWS
ncbi:hypothetical protein L1987_78099 [Smallanthus sonchifolius]|uniref:Uncharacterized protein n=1 Tax=Smallanthus sonchifolius TaxID=185202 RepID=A0ACB8ZCR5_9ASTR|nr:hypothetical protein L1987_78099 [Smallanthus sonchifolius]